MELAARYDAMGADEVVFLDITASSDDRDTIVQLATRAAEEVYIPFTIGGGVRSVEDARRLLRAGADKVSVNSAAVTRPQLVAEIAPSSAPSAVVVAIDARRGTRAGLRGLREGRAGRHRYRTRSSGRPRPWRLGAGEILLTSMDRDGTKDGFDLELTRAVSDAVNVPVIASGGVGTLDHLVEGVRRRAAPTPCWPRRSSTSAPTPWPRPSATSPRRGSPCGLRRADRLGSTRADPLRRPTATERRANGAEVTYPGVHALTTPGKAAVIMAGSPARPSPTRSSTQRSNRLARLWRQRGLGLGDHVAIFAENHPRYFEVFWAALQFGPVLHDRQPLPHRRGGGLRRRRLRCPAARSQPRPGRRRRSTTCPGPAGRAVAHVGRHRRRLRVLRGRHGRSTRRAAGAPARGAAMLYSSGTTGRPKGISDRSTGRPSTQPDGCSAADVPSSASTADAVYLSPAPLYHSAPLAFTT